MLVSCQGSSFLSQSVCLNVLGCIHSPSKLPRYEIESFTWRSVWHWWKNKSRVAGIFSLMTVNTQQQIKLKRQVTYTEKNTAAGVREQMPNQTSVWVTGVFKIQVYLNKKKIAPTLKMHLIYFKIYLVKWIVCLNSLMRRNVFCV